MFITFLMSCLIVNKVFMSPHNKGYNIFLKLSNKTEKHFDGKNWDIKTYSEKERKLRRSEVMKFNEPI